MDVCYEQGAQALSNCQYETAARWLERAFDSCELIGRNIQEPNQSLSDKRLLILVDFGRIFYHVHQYRLTFSSTCESSFWFYWCKRLSCQSIEVAEECKATTVCCFSLLTTRRSIREALMLSFFSSKFSAKMGSWTMMNMAKVRDHLKTMAEDSFY